MPLCHKYGLNDPSDSSALSKYIKEDETSPSRKDCIPLRMRVRGDSDDDGLMDEANDVNAVLEHLTREMLAIWKLRDREGSRSSSGMIDFIFRRIMLKARARIVKEYGGK